ncbi:IclR family transcriptional regulator [Teichococcus vastitatis]|uniref:IclR family transcriptional regulator n=1 Tax=Teichococcus vastitatis TaxID=2307076 RepID=A0ABS9W9P9_9PROT|nr:IclR family transcriptional regulator [Pseudoroseomonas vastitatis]MCI0755966.1 IclR family transcriptional regulator [Pseudoroseomonas vastitatis]
MTTLSNAGQVLRCFSPGRQALTVTEVAELLDLPKSNVSRLLRGMRDAGLLENLPDRRGYRPGILMFELGQAYRRDTALVGRAHAAVSRVCRRFGHGGYVSTRDGADVIGLIHHQEGPRMLRLGMMVGRRLPAFAAASGRALLARLSDAEVRRLCPEPLLHASREALHSQEELLRRLAEVRRAGYATAANEADAGTGSVAVAVEGPTRDEDLSLCIVYPFAVTDGTTRQRVAEALLAEAREVMRSPRRTVPTAHAVA